MCKSKWRGALRYHTLLLACLLAACGPRARVPVAPVAVPNVVDNSDMDAHTARALAPLLYLHEDETFRLLRVVATIHSTRRIIGYHLLWRDDVHGSWIPGTTPTDEEIVWVGYDSTRAPTELWTYWHGTILHIDWRGRGAVAIDVQWGKHGSMPRGLISADLPWPKKLGMFWLGHWVGLPDIWLSRVQRKGPLCFCSGYAHYREFTRPMAIADRLDAIVRADDPRRALRAVFGRNYSKKPLWP